MPLSVPPPPPPPKHPSHINRVAVGRQTCSAEQRRCSLLATLHTRPQRSYRLHHIPTRPIDNPGIVAVTKHSVSCAPSARLNNSSLSLSLFLERNPPFFLLPCTTIATVSPATGCPTTPAESRSRCRRSAYSYQEDRDPHAHRLPQATVNNTSRRSRNAHIPAHYLRHSHRHHDQQHCALTSTDPKARAGSQTPRHLHQAPTLGQQRSTLKVSTMKL